MVPVTVPTAVENFPRAQLMHADAVHSLYLPATQSVHAEAANPRAAEPAEQFLHASRDVAAITADAEPALQFVHASVPFFANEYLPAGQSMQTVPRFGANWPRVQLVHTDKPDAGAIVPPLQIVHDCCFPTDTLPGPQVSHGSFPRVLFALPGSHSVHTTSPSPV